MKKAITLILRTLLIYGCGSTNDANRQDVLQEAANVIDTVTSEGELLVAVTAVGNTSGQLWSHSGGHRDAQKIKVAADENIIWIASMTKLIKTIGALQLVEQEFVDLDAPSTASVSRVSELQVHKGFAEQDKTI